jgi:hypothetical protein
MCLLWGTNWVFISQKTAFFIVTAVRTSNLTVFGSSHLFKRSVRLEPSSKPSCPVQPQSLISLSPVHSDEATKPKPKLWLQFPPFSYSPYFMHGCYPALCIQLTIVPGSAIPSPQHLKPPVLLSLFMCGSLYSKKQKSSLTYLIYKCHLSINPKH